MGYANGSDYDIHTVSLDDVVKIEFGQNILDIGREPSQIVPEVGFDVIRVSQQLFKCELAGIVELITGSQLCVVDFLCELCRVCCVSSV